MYEVTELFPLVLKLHGLFAEQFSFLIMGKNIIFINRIKNKASIDAFWGRALSASRRLQKNFLTYLDHTWPLKSAVTRNRTVREGRFGAVPIRIGSVLAIWYGYRRLNSCSFREYSYIRIALMQIQRLLLHWVPFRYISGSVCLLDWRIDSLCGIDVRHWSTMALLLPAYTSHHVIFYK